MLLVCSVDMEIAILAVDTLATYSVAWENHVMIEKVTDTVTNTILLMEAHYIVIHKQQEKIME